MWLNDKSSLSIAFVIWACFSGSSLISAPQSMSSPEGSFLRTTKAKTRFGALALFSQDFNFIELDQDSEISLGQPPKNGTETFAGFGLFFEHPMHKLIVVGGQLNARFHTKGGIGYFDFDVMAKLPFAIGVRPLADDFYLGLPVGLTFGHIFSEKLKSYSYPNPWGGNVGLVLGKNFAFLEHYGLFAELGYRLSHVSTKDERASFSILTHSMVANLGASFAW